MENLLNMVEANSSLIILILLVLCLIFFVLLILALVKSTRAEKIFKSFVGDARADNVELLLTENSIKIQDIFTEMNLIKQEIKKLEGKLAFAIQYVGIVKYNAFDNVGNNLSFSLALLDQFKNGVIITSIYGRDFTTIYGKPIQYGKSDYQLSDEEIEAVDRALKGEFKEKKLN
ncbi:MAG: DUF4446 family protein [Tissierellia bacterium]|nr:DUF4446 family protein [Tissierellia bacterium]